MYDLRKIIIMGNYDLKDTSGLETVVMLTEGMKIVSLLYLNDNGSMPDKKSLKEELKNELYSDMYDENDLVIKTKEVINGEEAVYKIGKFIDKNWDKDTLVYFYDPDSDVYDKLYNFLLNTNSEIYLERYDDIFEWRENQPRADIYEIMKNNNLKIENLIKDNKISMVYFLTGLVEKLYSK